jgi:aconitate hydratase
MVGNENSGQPHNSWNSFSTFAVNGNTVSYYSLPALEKAGIGKMSKLPISIRIVLESLLRNMDGKSIKQEDVTELANWNAKNPSSSDVPFKVARVLMQDFTGVPAVVDLAAMRDYVISKGKSPELVQPIIPVDLIIDHSVQVDSFNYVDAIAINQEKEIERNAERYRLLKWANGNLKNFRVLPPSAGICHQVNLEYIATCVTSRNVGGTTVAFPDTLVGTDSHTTMIDGLGVIGFGVGGIEAEAALLNQPVSFNTPKVLGVHLTGALKEGVTATDFALTLTKILRNRGVVDQFVEFFGDGLQHLSLPDRATLSNMCPEYGATIAFFPVDEETLRYMESTGRSKERIDLVRAYYTAQEMLNADFSKIEYSDVLEVDIASIVPSVSGPSQPKQQIPLGKIRDEFDEMFLMAYGGMDQGNGKIGADDYSRWSAESASPGSGSIKKAPLHERLKSVKLTYDDGYETMLSDGDVVISSITSCTNTSNPSVMVAAGLLAKKALEKGLSVNTRKVKTSLGPGSRVVTRYLEQAGLMEPLQKLGYGLVGYGCITCIGNSGPLIDKQSDAINKNGLVVASVLSGNRNYEARIHRDVRANYLMSPPLLVAFGIAGTVIKDLTTEPLAKNKNGEDVYLRDIWPTQKEINDVVSKVVSRDLFEKEYGSNIYDVNPYWNKLDSPTGITYSWDPESTYILSPPFYGWQSNKSENGGVSNARVLAVFGDSISTDHISPAGAIGNDSPAGKYLIQKGVSPVDFNTYGARRGNHEVMMRGAFANNRIKNLMLPGVEGGFTLHLPDGQKTSIYDAAIQYQKENVPLVVMAGLEYGSGSSRDWAAKGPALLGVRAIVAKSFERIHRSNLIGMGIVPFAFESGQDFGTLGIDPTKSVSIELLEQLQPRQKAKLRYTKKDGTNAEANLLCRIDSQIELEYYNSGGVLNYVADKLIKQN